MPYKYISKYGITMEGLPEGVVLKPPGSYGKATLKEIIARKDLLRVTCMYYYQLFNIVYRILTNFSGI